MRARSAIWICLISVTFLYISCSDPEIVDHCRNGDAPLSDCCETDPVGYADLCCERDPVTYADLCEQVNNTNNTNNTNNSNNSNNATCDPACTGDQVCDDGTCVDCVMDDDCTDGVCDAGACVACVDNEDCDGATPVCAGSGAEAICVECSTDNTDACGADEVCDTADGVCVACLVDSDCSAVDAAQCDTETNTCVGCDDSTQCAGIGDTETCNVGSASCVECITATESADCNGNACDVSDNTCSDIAIGAAMGCQPCVSDSSCAADHFCIPLDYDGSSYGNYCMPVPGMDINGNPTCLPTYGAGIETRATTDGAMPMVCVIKESLTTCEAISVYEESCTPTNGNEPSPGDCEVEGVAAPGARCELVGGLNRCSYSCTGDPDCKNEVSCGGPQGDDYCGGP